MTATNPRVECARCGIPVRPLLFAGRKTVWQHTHTPGLLGSHLPEPKVSR